MVKYLLYHHKQYYFHHHTSLLPYLSHNYSPMHSMQHILWNMNFLSPLRMNPTTAGICPGCRHPASLPLLRPCRDVVVTLQHFKDARPALLLLVQSQGPANTPASTPANPNTNTNTDIPRSSQVNSIKKMSHMDFHKQSKEKVKKALEKLTENCRKKLRLDGDKGKRSVIFYRAITLVTRVIIRCVYNITTLFNFTKHWDVVKC